MLETGGKIQMMYKMNFHRSSDFDSKLSLTVDKDRIPDEVIYSGNYCIYQYMEAFLTPRGLILESFSEVNE